MAAALDWTRDGRNWPHRERSRFVAADGQRWHVQQWPAPTADALHVLLIHGTGASSHSWRGLAPLLAARCGVLSVDLPGHGFSDPASGDKASMHGMARSLAALTAALGITPRLCIGHSAGAAIAVRMALQNAAPATVVSLNGALLPLSGVAASLFPPAARLLAANPLVPRLFSWHASGRTAMRRLLASTGSTLDEESAALYRLLAAHPGHVAGALAMMARWDLPALAADLPRLASPLHLVVGSNDRTVPPTDALRVRELLPQTRLHRLAGLGHLAHEEDPAAMARLVLGLIEPASARTISVAF